MTRRGFTLTELIVAMAVLAIMGTALARLLLSNSRFVARQEAQLDARQTARAAMNILAAEVRSITDGGLRAATPTGFAFRMPVAFGLLCGANGGSTIASLAPVDSAVYYAGALDGVAWRQTDGDYATLDNVGISTSTDTGTCTADSIRLIPDGQLVEISATALGAPGQVMYLYRNIRYEFYASLAMPGRVALWRRQSDAASREILAPFASDAGFAYLVGSRLEVEASPLMSDMVGVELRLIAESEVTPPGQQGPARFALTPRIKFVNKGL